MAPALALQKTHGSLPGMTLRAAELAWMNQASRCHGHFGLKSAPQHRDFRPEKVGVN